MPILFRKLWNENFLHDRETFPLPERSCQCVREMDFYFNNQWSIRVIYGNKTARHLALLFLKNFLSILAADNFSGLYQLK